MPDDIPRIYVPTIGVSPSILMKDISSLDFESLLKSVITELTIEENIHARASLESCVLISRITKEIRFPAIFLHS